jgi:hypothetical protein
MSDLMFRQWLLNLKSMPEIFWNWGKAKFSPLDSLSKVFFPLGGIDENDL